MKRESETIKFLRELREQSIPRVETRSGYEKLRRSLYWEKLRQEEKDRLYSMAYGIWLQWREVKRLREKMLSD